MIETSLYQTALRYLGVKEIPGAKHHPWIQWAFSLTKFPEPWTDEDAWCFEGDVEILTENGFVKFKELTDGIKVAQVNQDTRGINYTYPNNIINKNYNGELAYFKSRTIEMICESNHRFIGKWNKANSRCGNEEMRPIKDLTSNLFISNIQTSILIDNPIYSDADLMLLAAFLSDGFVKKGSRTHKPWRWSIQVSKQRKVDFLKKLNPVNECVAKKAYGKSVVPLTTFSFNIPNCFSNIWDEYKLPSYDFLYSLSLRQIRVFVDTYLVFDGTVRGRSCKLYTSLINLRDWLHIAVTYAGHHSSCRISSVSKFSGKPCYEIVYNPNKKTRYIKREDVSFRNGDLNLYCVSVPSGLIVIRDLKGTVLVVGNCSAAMNAWCYDLGLPRSGSAAAISWLEVGQEIRLDQAVIGEDIIVFAHHVGIYAGPMNEKFIKVLGGNQSNQVCVSPYEIGLIRGVRRLA